MIGSLRSMTRTWAVFTKPWAEASAAALGPLVAGMGFDAVELPVRRGACVTPEDAVERLPGFVAELADRGVGVASVASEPTEPVFAACAAAGVDLIRIMAPVGPDGYRVSVDRLRRDLAAVAPWCERYGVRVGIQPHHGAYVSTVLGVLELIDELPAEWFGVIWDAAHDALAGEVDPATTLDLAMPRLMMVNLKNAEYRRRESADGVSYGTWFGPADEGMADWGRILVHLDQVGWSGPVCLTAQYTGRTPAEVEELVSADLGRARSLTAS
jgi:sugar phosphate isomerase/epimerase